jgi:plasmid stabilization system protein ParE
MKVVYTDEALRDLDEILTFSAARNVALRTEMLVEAIEQLFNNASLGELLAE